MTMRLAYADPPHIGQARRHYANDPSGVPAEEVDPDWRPPATTSARGDFDEN
jgi:hypothetical protein